MAYKAFTAKEQLERELKREPSLCEIGERIGVPVEEIAVAIDASSDIESLHKVIYQGDGNEILLMDRVLDDNNEIRKLTDKVTLEELLSRLDGEERRLIYMRYFQEMTQTQIAQSLGISQVQVSRLEKKILEKMKKLGEDYFDRFSDMDVLARISFEKGEASILFYADKKVILKVRVDKKGSVTFLG